MEETCSWYDVGCSLAWLSDEIKLIWQSVIESMLGAFAYVLEQIPVPDFMLNIQNNSFQIPASVLYWTDFFEVPFGLGAFIAALTLRFILRRIPIIG